MLLQPSKPTSSATPSWFGSIFGRKRSDPLHDIDTEAAASSGKVVEHDYLLAIVEQLQRGSLYSDPLTVLQGALSLPKPIDDRKLQMEKAIGLLASAPPNDELASALTDSLVRYLWQDLPHPPGSYVNAQSKFRAADGSGNSFTDPRLGAAGSPYAHLVPPLHVRSDKLPSPEKVFDQLLKRDKFVPHPSGISSLLVAFAAIIITSVTAIDLEDPCFNEASAYLDLSPLYGNNQQEQDKIRTFKQGLIHPDVVARAKMFFLPPSVVALLVMFSRNHNHIAHKLFEINEHGKHKPISELDSAGIKKQDEELFQTAKLVNCGWFINAMRQDYFRVMLNNNLTDSTWALNPTTPIRSLVFGPLSRGGGHAISAEFNAYIHCAHTVMSEADTKYTERLVRPHIGDKPFEEMTAAEFQRAIEAVLKANGTDPRKFTLPRYEREESGKFSDADLAKILSEATDEVAGAFKARGSPAVMRIVDILGIATARNDWNTCSLNEFRDFLNLTTFKTFDQWNDDPEIAKAAKELYGHPDAIELFPGLLAEQAKPSMPGSGMAAGYTLSRAILSDAIALTRGDRYFTTDFNTASLTSYGFKDVQPDLDNLAFGGVMGRLLRRNLPGMYPVNSVYALFPFSTPKTTRKVLTDLGIADRYSFELILPKGGQQ